MKRKVLCYFSVLLFVLLFCTLLSPKIEEEMRTQLEIKEVKGSNYTKRNPNIPISALQWQDEVVQLYCIVEGSGWESGLRVAEIPRQYYRNEGGHVALGPGTDYALILSASRRPESGGTVEVVEEFITGEDTYLLYFPNGVDAPEKLPGIMEPISSSETGILAAVRKAKVPFFEHRISNSLSKINADGVRVYSMTAVEQFLQALPWITGIVLVLLIGIILCIVNCIFVRKKENGSVVLWVNGTIAGAGLCVLPVLLQKFDLPASLMPRESILDAQHYLSEFQNIFTVFASFERDTLMPVWTQIQTQCGEILGLGIGALVLLITLELLLRSLLRKRQLRQN